jgi:hypothetical protein
MGWALSCRVGHLSAEIGTTVPKIPIRRAFDPTLRRLQPVRGDESGRRNDQMVAQRSRSYRMRLSPAGTNMFLCCHCRLAHLIGSFIPYGSTLFVAVLLAKAGDPSELLAELGGTSIARFAGEAEHFVGASRTLAELVEQICERLLTSGGIVNALWPLTSTSPVSP